MRKENDTIYMKVNSKFKAIGKLYDREHMPYGNYFVSNKKYGRAMNWIGAAPDPDFIGLETALEESRDEIRIAVRKIVQDFVDDPDYFKQDYNMVDQVIQAIRKTYLDKQKQMLKILSR